MHGGLLEAVTPRFHIVGTMEAEAPAMHEAQMKWSTGTRDLSIV